MRHLAITTSVALMLSACGGAGPSQDQITRSQKEYELAVGLAGENNTSGAFEHLTRATTLDPDNADAHLMLGTLFLMRRDDVRAEKHLKEVIRIDPRDPRARTNLGALYNNQKRYQEAIKELEPATDDLINREAHLAWGNLGWAHYELKDYPRALNALQRSIDLQKRFCVGHYRMGQTYRAMGDLPKADAAYSLAIDADPKCQEFQEAWADRGQIRLKLGRKEEARTDFERCVEIKSDNAPGEACRKALETLH